MEPRLNFYKSSPEAMKAMSALEQQIARSGLEKSLIELVRLRASQINGCAYCIDVYIPLTHAKQVKVNVAYQPWPYGARHHSLLISSAQPSSGRNL